MKTCEYCGGEFMPKRSDAAFCSHSCRQMAYVQRKDTDAEHSINGLSDNDNNEGAIHQSGEPISENPTKLSTTPQKPDELDSIFLSEFHELLNQRDGEIYMIRRSKAGFSPSEKFVYTRYRCFCDYLLNFSEQPFILLNHLKELHNAFLQLTESEAFSYIDPNSIYKTEIREWQARLKKHIIANSKETQLIFRLDRDLRIELMCSRYELARCFKKRLFSDLDPTPTEKEPKKEREPYTSRALKKGKR